MPPRRPRRSVPLLAALMMLLLLVAAALTSQRTTSVAAAPLHQADATDVSVGFDGTQPEVVESKQGDESFMTFDTPLPLSDDPGAPALPVDRRLVAIPAGVTPTLTVALADPEALPSLPYPILPAPTMQLPDNTLPEEVTQLEARYTLADNLPTDDGWYPASPVRMSETMAVRGQTMVRVEFVTVQVNLTTGDVRWYPSADATVSWDGTTAIIPDQPVEDPTYDQVLGQMVVNPDQARAWRVQEEAPDTPLVNPQWRISLEDKGLYRVPLTALAGVTPAMYPRLAVYFGPIDAPVEQAVWITGNYLYLVNVREPGFWSTDIVYRIELLPAGQLGLRMAQIASDPVAAGADLFLPMLLRGASGGRANSGTIAAPAAPPAEPSSPSLWTTSVPYEQRYEENLTYLQYEAADKPLERWHWRSLFVNPALPTDEFSTTFNVANHDAAAGLPVTITSELGPALDNNARCRIVTVTVNDIYTATKQWTSNSEPFGQVITMPTAALQTNANSYYVHHELCSGTINADRILLNAFIVRYQRWLLATNNQFIFDNPQSGSRTYNVSNFSGGTKQGFEISTLNAPRLITGGASSASGYIFGRPSLDETYLAANLDAVPSLVPVSYTPSGLRTNLQHADYIVVTPPEFQTALTPLIMHIQSRGQVVRTVKTTDIYNDFGVGTMDPQAIRYFIEFAYSQWGAPKPAYLLLVGDGNYDPKNYLGTSLAVFVPPYLLDADEFLGEVPADNAFVSDLAAGPDDDLPDMHVGRLPAGSTAHVTTMVNKIINYETATPGGTWSKEITFLADNPDGGGDFHQYSENLLPYITSGALIHKLYLPDPGSTTAVRTNLINQLNNGELILQYIGHASVTQWADSTGLWNVRRPPNPYGDLDSLSTGIGHRQPVNLPWACWDGYFVFPDTASQSVAEVMLRTYVNRGAVASFSPTGLDLASAHDQLARGFFQGLFSNDGIPSTLPVTQLGPLTLLAKMQVVNTSYSRLLNTYMLLGDPGMDIALDPCFVGGSCR